MEKWKRLYIEEEEELKDVAIDIDTLVLNIVDDELVEEGAGKLIGYSVLAFILGSAGIVEGAEFRRGVLHMARDKQVQDGTLTITKGELKGIIDKAKAPEKMAGKWTEVQARNIIMRTLYSEARGDGKVGMDMVMTVIWNRGAQDVKHLADECLRRKQFSCWNAVTNTVKTPATYTIQFPESAK